MKSLNAEWDPVGLRDCLKMAKIGIRDSSCNGANETGAAESCHFHWWGCCCFRCLGTKIDFRIEFSNGL